MRALTPKRHLKISPTRNRERTDPARAFSMKTKALLSLLVAITAVTLSSTTWAAGHGGGGSGGGFIGGVVATPVEAASVQVAVQ